MSTPRLTSHRYPSQQLRCPSQQLRCPSQQLRWPGSSDWTVAACGGRMKVRVVESAAVRAGPMPRSSLLRGRGFAGFPGGELLMDGAPYPASATARTAVLTLPAEIDITNARLLCGEVGSALVSGATIVVADLTATTFCDSSGARILVLAWEQAAVNGIELRIVVPSATVR